VLQTAAADLITHGEQGMSVMEMSHRSDFWVEHQRGIEANLRTLAGISDDYHVLFLQGGATTQFATVPLNLLSVGASADYILTGVWSVKAMREAQKLGYDVRASASSEDSGFDHIPTDSTVNPGAVYVHYTSNNTIYGTGWNRPPDCGHGYLVCDASSDIFSRPMDVAAHGLIYAGAQKNLGPAGVTLVIVRKDLVGAAPADVPTMLDYAVHAAKDSAHNTPPVWSIYMLGLSVQWILDQGGLEAMARHNERKARLLYDVIDAGDFYKGHALPESRSLMNITFNLGTSDLEARFLEEAGGLDMLNLRGHRSVGGCRASIYNAVPFTSVETLSEFMVDFARRHG